MKKKPSEEKEEAQASVPPAAPAVPETPEADAVSAEIKVLEDQMLRLRADFENYRKRSARERQEWTERAAEELLTQLLPVLDHFELGLKTAREHQTDTAVVDGFQLVYDQLQSALLKAGLKPIAADPGTTFDPHLHEAVSTLPSDTTPAVSAPG